MTKSTKWHVCPAKTHISLGICPVWSESLLSAWRKLGSLVTYCVHSKDADQTGWMPRLSWVFAGCTCHFVGFAVCWLISGYKGYQDAKSQVWALSKLVLLTTCGHWSVLLTPWLLINAFDPLATDQSFWHLGHWTVLLTSWPPISAFDLLVTDQCFWPSGNWSVLWTPWHWSMLLTIWLLVSAFDHLASDQCFWPVDPDQCFWHLGHWSMLWQFGHWPLLLTIWPLISAFDHLATDECFWLFGHWSCTTIFKTAQNLPDNRHVRQTENGTHCCCLSTLDINILTRHEILKISWPNRIHW